MRLRIHLPLPFYLTLTNKRYILQRIALVLKRQIAAAGKHLSASGKGVRNLFCAKPSLLRLCPCKELGITSNKFDEDPSYILGKTAA